MKKKKVIKKDYFCRYFALVLCVITVQKISFSSDTFEMNTFYTRIPNSEGFDLEHDVVLSQKTVLILNKLILGIDLLRLSDVINWIKNRAESDAITDIKSIGISSRSNFSSKPPLKKLSLTYDQLLCFRDSLNLMEKLHNTRATEIQDCNFRELYENVYAQACENNFLQLCPSDKIRLLNHLAI